MHRDQAKSCNRVLTKRWQHRDQLIHQSKIDQARSFIAEHILSSPNAAGSVTIEDSNYTQRRSINRKKLLLEEERATEIERENRILFEKMYHIMNKSSRVDKGTTADGRNVSQHVNATNNKIYNTIADPGGAFRKPRNSANRYANSPLIIETKASNSPRGVINKSPISKEKRAESYIEKSTQKRLHDENMRFLNRLMSQRSHLDVVEMKEKRKQEEKMLKHLCHFPHIFNSQATPKNALKAKRIQEFQKFNHELLKKLHPDQQQSPQLQIDTNHNEFNYAPPLLNTNSLGIQNTFPVDNRRNSSTKNGHQIFSDPQLIGQYANGFKTPQHNQYESNRILNGGDFQTQKAGNQQYPQRYQIEKAVLKPLDLGEGYGVPIDRRVLFRRVTFTKTYHKVLIELSKKKNKFFIIVKKFKNDKYKYHVKEMFWIQAQKVIAMFNGDFQAMVDQTIVMNSRKGMPPVDFSQFEKLLYSQASTQENSHYNQSQNSTESHIQLPARPQQAQSHLQKHNVHPAIIEESIDGSHRSYEKGIIELYEDAERLKQRSTLTVNDDYY